MNSQQICDFIDSEFEEYPDDSDHLRKMLHFKFVLCYCYNYL